MKIIEGGLSVDDRGTITFVNDFDFKGVKRFFMVQNHAKGFVRAWHGHKKEAKYVFVASGSILLGVVAINDWEKPESASAERVVLSASKPQVAYIPAGYASGFKTLTNDARVIIFSTTTVEESKGDDFRFPAETWDVWSIDQR